MANEDINGAINYLKVYRKMDEKLHNMSPKDSVSYFATNECLKYWDMAIKALETIPKYKDAYGKGWIDGVNATNVDCGVVWEERIDAIKAEIQERQRTMMPVIPVQEVFEIIDKHCGGENE